MILKEHKNFSMRLRRKVLGDDLSTVHNIEMMTIEKEEMISPLIVYYGTRNREKIWFLNITEEVELCFKDKDKDVMKAYFSVLSTKDIHDVDMKKEHPDLFV